MQNKPLIIGISAIIALLCLYNLSFTWVAQGVESDAREYATRSGEYQPELRRSYLDSMYRKTVVDLGFDDYTYAEVLQKELKLGLDLQGGMHVIIEVDPRAVIVNLATLKKDQQLQEALERADEAARNSQGSYVNLFVNAYEEVAPQSNLSRLFATSANKDQITFASSNSEVEEYLEEIMQESIDLSFQVIRSRVDEFGTAQPNIQKLPGSGRIQVELPGVDNPDRVRNLLTSVAQLEFVEVYTLKEIDEVIGRINTYLAENEDRPEIKALRRQDLVPTGGEEEGFLGEETEGSSFLEEEGGSFLDGDEDEVRDNVEDDLINESQDTLESDPVDSKVDNTITETNYDTATDDETEQVIASALDSLEAPDSAFADTAAEDSLQASVFYELVTLTSPQESLNQGYYMFGSRVQDTAKVRKMFNLPGVRALLPPGFSYSWEYKAFDAGPEQYINIYFLKRGRGGKPTMSGDVVTDARDNIGPSGKPEVSMSMSGTGAQLWRQVTTNNVGERVAIVLDKKVYSAPNINEPIPNGNSSISGSFTIQEAKDLANVLKAGKLPAPTRIVEEAVVGPTIGAEAISNGFLSMVTGIILVLIFMIAYYALGGVVANIALLLNIFFILGILAQFNTALTLPGIASIVLTIGMSVDANVLIFERIREELKNGAKLLSAIELGFNKALSSIIDANVTTFLTGAILFIFGTGGVKGFGVTLMIGIACSLLSAVFITRVLIDLFARGRFANNLNFVTPISKRSLDDLGITFMKRRKLAYVISGAVIALGIGATVVNGGLNLGVDFRGGRTFIVKFDEAVSSNAVRSALLDDFQGEGTEVKTYNRADQMKITTSYLIKDDSKEGDEQVRSALVAGLGEDFSALHPEILSSAKVGASIADDIQNKALQSIVIALALIFLYILIRFLRWEFSLGAIAALFHDVLVVLSVFAIADLLGLSFEIDQVFIAAALTVVGYSINDTVVVFDRIREYSGKLSSSEIIRNMDHSINTCLSRTLMTSVTTLIVVLMLLIFGGEALSGFSFALLIGVIVGTYSSMFVASPVVYDLARSRVDKPKKKAVAA